MRIKFIISALLLSLLNSCFSREEMCKEDLRKSWKPEGFNGIVIKKYISDNHEFPTLAIRDFRDTLIYTGMYSHFDDGLWDSVKKGDTLVKKPGTLLYTLKKRNGDVLKFTFNCNSVKGM